MNWLNILYKYDIPDINLFNILYWKNSINLKIVIMESTQQIIQSKRGRKPKTTNIEPLNS